MNAPDPSHHAPGKADITMADLWQKPLESTIASDAENEPDIAQRNPGLLIIAAVVMVAALLSVLYFGANRAAPDYRGSPAAPAAARTALHLSLPDVPGLGSASRAFSPSSSLVALARSHEEIPVQETLAAVGPDLSPEWRLALVLARGPASAAVEAPRALRASDDALARMPALPPLEESVEKMRVGSLPARQPALISSEIVHPGITRRVYASRESLVAQELNECSTLGFLARAGCRERVCEAHWGKVAACPVEEPAILP